MAHAVARTLLWTVLLLVLALVWSANRPQR